MPDQLSIEVFKRDVALNGPLGVDESHAEHPIGQRSISDALLATRAWFSTSSNDSLAVAEKECKVDESRKRDPPSRTIHHCPKTGPHVMGR